MTNLQNYKIIWKRCCEIDDSIEYVQRRIDELVSKKKELLDYRMELSDQLVEVSNQFELTNTSQSVTI